MQDWYAQFRPGIPKQVSDWILHWVGERNPGDRLLDLGTGTGQVLLALGSHFGHITAVDPSHSMLMRAKQQCASLATDREIVWLEEPAETAVSRAWQDVTLVTACRSFHWMDKAFILDALSRTTPAHAGVVLFSDSSLWNSVEPWAIETRQLVQSFLGKDRRARHGFFAKYEKPFEATLADSAFSKVEKVTIEVTRQWSPETVLGYLYSTTFAAPDLFGDQRTDFEHSLAQLLEGFSASKPLTEHNAFTIFAARR